MKYTDSGYTVEHVTFFLPSKNFDGIVGGWRRFYVCIIRNIPCKIVCIHWGWIKVDLNDKKHDNNSLSNVVKTDHLVLHPLRNYTFSIGYFVSPQGGGRKRSESPLTDDNVADGKIDNAESIVSRWMAY
jgi:hypothetical protein